MLITPILILLTTKRLRCGHEPQTIVAGNGERWAVPRSGFIDPESDSGTRVDSVRFDADSAFPQPDRRFRFGDSTVLVLESIE